MSQNAILLLGASQFQRERALIGAEQTKAGLIITVAKDAPFTLNKHALQTLSSDESNPQQLLNDVNAFLERTKLTLKAVIPLNDFVLNAGYAVATAYHLTFHTRDTIDCCRKKI